MQLAPICLSIEHRNFPVNELHWDARISADWGGTWTGPFQSFEVSAKSVWDSPGQLAPHHEPVRGSWQLHYRYDPNTLFISAGEFETPSSHGTVDGLLAPRNSLLNVKFETQSQAPYKDCVSNFTRSEEHTSELQSLTNLVCRLLLEKKKKEANIAP